MATLRTSFQTMATTQLLELGGAAIHRWASKSVKELLKLCEKAESYEKLTDDDWHSAFLIDYQKFEQIWEEVRKILLFIHHNSSLFADDKSYNVCCVLQSIHGGLFRILIAKEHRKMVEGLRSSVNDILIPICDGQSVLRTHCVHFLEMS